MSLTSGTNQVQLQAMQFKRISLGVERLCGLLIIKGP